MTQPKPGEMTYSEIIGKIKDGALRVPQFQRNFVWDMQASAALLDSIIKGFPIGTFILWKTKEDLRTVKGIGSTVFPIKEKGDFVYYILDGQQRITSLFACMEGAIVVQDGEKKDYAEIYVDLDAKDDEPIVTQYTVEGHRQMKLTELVHSSVIEIVRNYEEKKYIERIDTLRKRFDQYRFSTVTIEDATIEVATEIFTRLNIGGKKLSIFEIMVAKTYDESKNFDLAEKYDALIEELQDVKFETIPDSTLLQAVAVCLKKDCSTKVILQLDKREFIQVFDSVISALKSAIDYFRSYYRVEASEILPYDGMLVPFSYYFFNHPNKPLADQQKYLQDYFWRTVLNERFSNSMETKVTQDIKRIDKILKNELPTYEDGVMISVDEFIRRGWFSTSRAYIKGMLCILAYEDPKSFADGAKVNISNNWLKQANSKNYHHFFPKAYMRKANPDIEANNIANITIVDDFLNKRLIGAQAPGKYMSEFKKQNAEIDNVMKTHLIMDLNDFGVWTNDFETFLRKRSGEFCKKLAQRIIPTSLDVITLVP